MFDMHTAYNQLGLTTAAANLLHISLQHPD